jgi:xylose isomerase
MLVVLKIGGLGSGGLNFDAKPRRGSCDEMDLFYGHICGMDTFARGLLAAQKIIEDGILDDFVRRRYASYDHGIGHDILAGEASFETLEQYILDKGEPAPQSGRQEMLESILAAYI